MINEYPSINQTRWQPLEQGQGKLQHINGNLHFSLPAVNSQTYHNAQISDYAGLKRRHYPWEAPFKMTVQAQMSHSIEALSGTAGFGFWNHPFAPGFKDLPRLPRALWFFFGSPPGNIALARGVPGYGWKAATLDARNWRFLSLLPLAPAGFLLMRIPALYNLLWPVGQRALKVSEKMIDVDVTQSHTYTIIRENKQAQFLIDGETHHISPFAPSGRLGFIAWMDNQYAVVTPQGQFKFGFVDIKAPQHLILESISVENL